LYKMQNCKRMLEITQTRMKTSEFAKRLVEVDKIRKKKEELEKSERELDEIIKKWEPEANKLRKSVEDFKQDRVSKLKEITKEIDAGRTKLTKLKSQETVEKKRFNELEAQRKSAVAQVKEKEDEITGIQVSINKLEELLSSVSIELKQSQRELTLIKEEEKAEKERIDNQNAEIQRMKKEQKTLTVKSESLSIAQQQLTEDINLVMKNRESTVDTIKNLREKFTWIDDEKDSFNVPGSEYDFSQVDLTSLYKKRDKLKRAQEILDRKLNKKVINMLDAAESEERDLEQKLTKAARGKEHLEKAIPDLNNKKESKLEECFKSVRENFEKIFSLLLKGTSAIKATLRPVNAKEGISSGIAIKVAVGNTWKESLSELSGGQRSLLALSLILAIAKRNPAPIYILDEIDAALDINHTLNIGKMLKDQFSSSQFVIVSLKSGMFQNANALFRTEFVGGMSKVRKVRGS